MCFDDPLHGGSILNCKGVPPCMTLTQTPLKINITQVGVCVFVRSETIQETKQQALV